MPWTRTVTSTPPPDDEAFQKAMQILAFRPRRERNAVLAFIFWWFGMAEETRVGIVRVLRPEMKREHVAMLVGVSARRLGDWPVYQRTKGSPADYKHRRRRASKRQKTGNGGWSILDNPDRSDQ